MATPTSIVTIDLQQVDSDIKESEKKLDALYDECEKIEHHLDFLANLKAYILGKPKNGSSRIENLSAAANIGGVSDFILHFLKKNNKVRAKDVIEAYAKYLKDDPENVRNNVSNALSRLKADNKIDSEPVTEGKGYYWFAL